MMNTLIASALTPNTSKFSLRAGFKRLSPLEIELEFNFKGPSMLVLWPSIKTLAPTTARVDELWKTTCLEAFFSAGNSKNDPYFEINCAPSGQWNAYSFTGLRQNMKVAEDILVRLTEKSILPDQASFTFVVQSTSPLPTDFCGLTAVLETADHEKSYWALNHPEAQPNFHAKEGWKAFPTR